MNDKFNLSNAVLSLLTAGAIFMGGWVLTINTQVALLSQKIDTESSRNDESRAQYIKMSESINKLDKTLGLLADRLDRQYLSQQPKNNK